MKKLSKGFTLIELLVVISIISLLSSVVLATLNSARSKGKDAYRLSQIDAVKKALDLYYSNHGSYPADLNALDFSENIPHNWSDMIQALNTDNLLKATFTRSDSGLLAYLKPYKIAYGSVGPPPATYYPCSIQDPLYKASGDYGYSFGYVPSANQQTYKIRIYLENASNVAFNSSQTGTFLDSATTGSTACDKSLGYYCTGRN